MAGKPAPYFSDPVVPVVLGFAALGAAIWCFRDAYERRGRQRPAIVSYLGV